MSQVSVFLQKTIKAIDLEEEKIAAWVKQQYAAGNIKVQFTDPLTISAPVPGLVDTTATLTFEVKTGQLTGSVNGPLVQKSFQINIYQELGNNMATVENVLAVILPYIKQFMPLVAAELSGPLGAGLEALAALLEIIPATATAT